MYREGVWHARKKCIFYKINFVAVGMVHAVAIRISSLLTGGYDGRQGALVATRWYSEGYIRGYSTYRAKYGLSAIFICVFSDRIRNVVKVTLEMDA